MSKHYAQYNPYGSTTDVGFANTWQVASFDSRAARDTWVEQHADRLDIAAITRAEALKLAGPYQRLLARNGGHLAHVHFLRDGDQFVRAF